MRTKLAMIFRVYGIIPSNRLRFAVWKSIFRPRRGSTTASNHGADPPLDANRYIDVACPFEFFVRTVALLRSVVSIRYAGNTLIAASTGSSPREQNSDKHWRRNISTFLSPTLAWKM